MSARRIQVFSDDQYSMERGGAIAEDFLEEACEEDDEGVNYLGEESDLVDQKDTFFDCYKNFVTENLCPDILPIDLNLFKFAINVPVERKKYDKIFSEIILMVAAQLEKLWKKALLKKRVTFQYNNDNFFLPIFPYKKVEKVIKNGKELEKNQYKITLKKYRPWFHVIRKPFERCSRKENVKITYIAGYGESAADIAPFVRSVILDRSVAQYMRLKQISKERLYNKEKIFSRENDYSIPLYPQNDCMKSYVSVV